MRAHAAGHVKLRCHMRSLWEGLISFGLINIPVRLYSAVREGRVSFHYLRKGDHCNIRYVKVCRTTGEEVPYEDIVKGYEYEKGRYVVLEDEDFEKADVKKTHTIEVFQFVEEKEVDPMLFEKPYYLEPTKEADNAYALLRDALKRSKKLGIAKFVLRSREQLAIIRPVGDILVLNQIRYADEIIGSEQLHAPGGGALRKQELDIATQLIDQLTSPFDLGQYHDTYTEELQRIIKAKVKGKAIKAKGKNFKKSYLSDRI